MASNHAIGKDNQLMWHLPNDMKFFKNTTTGHVILTGRKNYFSIPEKYRPLKDRTNIVVTRQESLNLASHEDVEILSNIEEAIAFAKSKNESELFIIGGGQIYSQTMEIADRMYITHVHQAFEDADTHFPEIDYSIWKTVSAEHHSKDERHKYPYSIYVYDRIKK